MGFIHHISHTYILCLFGVTTWFFQTYGRVLVGYVGFSVEGKRQPRHAITLRGHWFARLVDAIFLSKKWPLFWHILTRNLCRQKTYLKYLKWTDTYSFIQVFGWVSQNLESFEVGIPRFWEKSHFGGLVNLNIDTQGDFLTKEWDGLWYYRLGTWKFWMASWIFEKDSSYPSTLREHHFSAVEVRWENNTSTNYSSVLQYVNLDFLLLSNSIEEFYSIEDLDNHLISI